MASPPDIVRRRSLCPENVEDPSWEWFVSLAFIHLVPSEAAAGVDMAKPPHQGVHFLRARKRV
jgi:hypothetical protein